jgi:hypothetical protein
MILMSKQLNIVMEKVLGYMLGETKVVIEAFLVETRAKPFLPQALKLINGIIKENAKFITSNTKEFTIKLQPLPKGKASSVGYNIGGAAAYATSIDMPPGQPSIVISVANHMDDKTPPSFMSKSFVESMRHEFRHLVDLKKNENHELRSAAAARIGPIAHKIQASINVASPSYEHLRVAYFEFLNAMMLEGLARFAERQLPLNKANFMLLYNSASLEQKKLHPFTEKYLKSLPGYTDVGNIFYEVRKEFYSASYRIGWHMVFTIRMMLPRIRPRNFFSMSQYQFIRLYEQACAKANIRPVVSLNSGKGMFDYNQIIKELYNIFSKKSKTGIRYWHKCPECKSKLSSDAKFCPTCGHEFKRPI